MSQITESARGENCTVRIPAVCNFNTETTVAAHFSLAGFSGKGIKSPDWMIAYACSACHDECDRRTQHHDLETVRLSHAEGVFRTQKLLFKKGLIK